MNRGPTTPTRCKRDAVVALIAVLFTGLCFTALGLGPDEPNVPRLIQAERIEIVDDYGQVIATLGDGESGGRLELFNITGDELRYLEFDTSRSRLKTLERDDPEDVKSDEADLNDIEVRPLDGASEADVRTAKLLIARGWEYVMPRPKSAQARWGNTDGRTTWWNGYWIHSESGRLSSTQPGPQDGFLGDGRGSRSWRRGGSPPRPSAVEWMCSKHGGVTPH